MWSVEDASPRRFHALATQINESGEWRGFLSPQEHQIFAVALESTPETWERFMKGQVACRVRFPGSAETKSVEMSVDPVTLAFRVRYMLWVARIDDLDDDLWAAEDAAKVPPPSENLTGLATNTEADEDYDDDYDDDDDEDSDEKASAKPDVTSNGLSEIIVDADPKSRRPDSEGRSIAVENGTRMYSTFDSDRRALQLLDEVKATGEEFSREELIANFMDTFDFDDVLDGRSPSGLAEPDSTLNASSGDGNASDAGGSGTAGSAGGGADGTSSGAGDSTANGFVALAKNAQFGSANLCLKHLLTTIEHKRSDLHVTDFELRNLISDVRKNRSKWASEERIGQEELYEACDRVVQELKGTTESSAPFLNKVSKREAPNYYDVIKEPMDLNTVTRKLRGFQYASKREFVADLDLIWTNCLTYNSDPAHFLRKHALTMRGKTEALAPLIPDITVRSRAEVEAEAEIAERRARELKRKREHEAEEPRKKPKEREHAKPGKGDHGDAETSEKEGEKEDDEDTSARPTSHGDGTEPRNTTSASRDGSVDPVDMIGGIMSRAADHDDDEDAADNKDNSDDNSDTEDLTDEFEAEGARGRSSLRPAERLPVLELPDAERAMWDRATRQKRLMRAVHRRALFSDNRLQMDEDAVVRSAGSMLQFEKALRGGPTATTSHSVGLRPAAVAGEPFLPEYELGAGLPVAPPGDAAAWLRAPVPRAADLPPSRYVARGELSTLITRNLNEMQMIRRLVAKISYVRDLQAGAASGFGMPGLIAPAPTNAVSFPSADGAAAGGTANGVAAVAGPGTSTSTNPAAASKGAVEDATGDYPPIVDPPEDISSRLPGAVPIDRHAAHNAMQRAVSKLFMHAGFEAANARAVDAMAAIAGDYLMKLGTSLVAGLEAPDSTASFADVMGGTLDEMGVAKPAQLTRYISDGVLRHGRRLAVFKSRLSHLLVDLLRPEVERYQDEQFAENSDQFVFGQFSNELGDDYFGFRELNLDKELGVANIAVPFHLLQQRAAGYGRGTGSAGFGSGSDGIAKLPFPEYATLTPEDIERMPPLFKAAFERAVLSPMGLNSDTTADEALSRATHSGPPDARAAIVLPAAAASGKPGESKRGDGKRGESRQAKEIARQLSGRPAEEQPGVKRALVAEALEQMAQTASAARHKLPANGKLVARKRRIESAFVLVKTEPPKDADASKPDASKTADGTGAETGTETGTGETGKAATDEAKDGGDVKADEGGEASAKADGDDADDSKVTGDGADGDDLDADLFGFPSESAADDGSDAGDVDNEINNEIGSLAFDDDPSMHQSAFTYDDSLPTGSLMMQGNEDEDEEDDVAEANDDLAFEFMNNK